MAGERLRAFLDENRPKAVERVPSFTVLDVATVTPQVAPSHNHHHQTVATMWRRGVTSVATKCPGFVGYV